MRTSTGDHTILPRGLWLRSLLTLLLMSGMLASGYPATTAVLTPMNFNPNELSYGLYWFGTNGAHQKFSPGELNTYFDPTKPTLIFAHGWQPFISDSLPNFDFNGTDTAAGWIAAGWNVGIFVWNQFSDETTGVTLGAWFGDGPPPQGVLDAEAKIWSANGPRGMRWRDWDNYLTGYSAPPSGTPSAGELFYQTYVAALPESYTQTIRIAGHSLGNQMAVHLTHLVDAGIAAGNVPANLRPARVALLDPYWSPEARTDVTDGLAAGRQTGDVVREIIARLTPRGTLFEWYWSSTWTTPPQGDANDALKPMVFYAEMDPAFETADLDKHMAAQHLYFWSHAFDGPVECTGEACLGMDVVLSRMSNAQLAAVLRSDYRWEQSAGQSTQTLADDAYQSIPQAGTPYTINQLTATPASLPPGGSVTVTAIVSAPEGSLVTLSTSLGEIAPRVIVNGGQAVAHLTSSVAGTAHISATTRGTDGTVQAVATAVFTEEAECLPITGVAIEGPRETPATLYIDQTYTFDAVITPTDATPPITYTWGAEALVSGQQTASATYRWDVPGTYTVTLTAENCGGQLLAAHPITVAEKTTTVKIYLPLIIRNP